MTVTELGPPTVTVSRAFDSESRARTHLANERTFLAWLRTGLSLVAVGLAAASFLPLDLIPHVPYVRIFSMLLIFSGIVTILLGARRYEVSGRQIDAGEMTPASSQIVAIAVIVAVLGAMALPLVVLLR